MFTTGRWPLSSDSEDQGARLRAGLQSGKSALAAKMPPHGSPGTRNSTTRRAEPAQGQVKSSQRLLCRLTA